MTNGAITEHGPHNTLMKKNNSAYAQMIETYGTKDVKTDALVPALPSSAQTTATKVIKTDLKDLDESTNTKLAGLEAYAMYIKGGGGCLFFSFIFSFVLMFGIGQQLTAVWLQQWLDAGDGKIKERKWNLTEMNMTLDDENMEDLRGNVTDNPDIGYFQLGLIIIMLSTYGVGIVKGFFISRFALRATSRLHQNMFSRIIRCPMSFFDTMPRGRILNRFSKDVDER